MVVAYYIIGAALAAWLTTGNGHLDWKLSILVLPLIFLVHFCHKAIGGRQGNKACLVCENEIGMFRKLAHDRFCCDEHERLYLAELAELAIQRLHNASLAASIASPRIEIPPPEGDDPSVSNHQPVTPVLEHAPALSLIVHPTAGKYRPSPAYR